MSWGIPKKPSLVVVASPAPPITIFTTPGHQPILEMVPLKLRELKGLLKTMPHGQDMVGSWCLHI